MPPDRKWLLDMALASRRATKWASRSSRDEFRSDLMLQSAIMYAVQIIGEAATHVSPETRIAIGEIPWDNVIGMRHHLVHGYFEIDELVLWDTVQHDLPKLMDALARHLESDA